MERRYPAGSADKIAPPGMTYDFKGDLVEASTLRPRKIPNPSDVGPCFVVDPIYDQPTEPRSQVQHDKDKADQKLLNEVF
jgi:hypothetical protein